MHGWQKPLIRISLMLTLLLSLCTTMNASAGATAENIYLPIHSLTPGAIDSAVTQSNISTTICVLGYTKTVRPPVSYTTPLKRAQLAGSYSRYNDLMTKDFEEDHLIPLELGGAPKNPKNLWPEPWNGSAGARMKDRLENKLHLLVCSEKLSLATAQRAIARDWLTAYSKYVLNN